MIEIPTYPAGNWRPVICRLCCHRFAVLVTDPAAEPVVLCQACALFVEVLGQPALPAPAPRPTPAASKSPKPPVLPAKLEAWAALAAVWAQWWTRWRESQKKIPLPDNPPAPEAEAGG